MLKLVSPDRILYVVETEADLQKLVTAQIVPNSVVAACVMIHYRLVFYMINVYQSCINRVSLRPEAMS